MRNLGFQVLVECPKPLQEAEIEDLARLDCDHGYVIAAELVAELVVLDQGRIVFAQEAFDRVVDREIGELGSQPRRQREHERDHPPAAANHPMAPALESRLDSLPDPHVSLFS